MASLDDPLEKYADNFTIKDPLGGPASSSVRTLGSHSPALTLRRMASQLSGNHTLFNDMVPICDSSTLKQQTLKNCIAWLQTSESPLSFIYSVIKTVLVFSQWRNSRPIRGRILRMGTYFYNIVSKLPYYIHEQLEQKNGHIYATNMNEMDRAVHVVLSPITN